MDVATDYHSVPPCRVLDTRLTSQPLIAGVPRAVQVAGQCGIPSTAKAVAVNVTVVGATAAGSLTLYPADEGVPLTSALSFGAGQVRSNNALVKLASDATRALGAVANLPSERSRCGCDIPPWSSPAWKPCLRRLRASRSAPCFVLTNTSANPRSAASSRTSACGFPGRSTQMNR